MATARRLDPLDFGGAAPGREELRKCTIIVEGMTCQSCVSVIQDTVPEKCSNVRSIVVSYSIPGLLNNCGIENLSSNSSFF